MSDIKTEDNDDFIVSSSDLEKDEADIAFEAKEKKKKKNRLQRRPAESSDWKRHCL